jgi:DNA polymerase I-like protein with 3'-5' exonuclease and polymerase domains
MNRQLLPTLRLSLEMTDVLARIEQSGIKINPDTLEEIKQEYEQELEQTQRRLDEIVHSVMGDTPINLNQVCQAWHMNLSHCIYDTQLYELI